MIIAQYTTSASGVVPRFDPYCEYEVNEIDNGNGTYTVTLTASNDFTYVDFIERYDLLSVEYLKVTNKVTTMDYMFWSCDSLTSINTNGWDTSNIIDMLETFCYCCSLEEVIGIENWNTSSLENLTYTFGCCESLTSLNLNGWDTSNVTLANGIFSDCTYLEELDISNWNLSNADTQLMSKIFYISEMDPENTDWYDETFKPYLKTIKCNNANTISLLAPYLPDRSACEEAGIIFTDNASEVNAEELVNLNWKVVELIAQYKFNKPINGLPLYQIPERIDFNNYGFVDTGIQLLKNDSDWTMFLDCIPNINNSTQAVIHCMDEGGSWSGISFSFEPNGNIGLWDGTKGTVIGNGDYLNKNIKIVIVKKDNNILVYHNNDPIYQATNPIIIPYTFKSTDSTLSIGGGHLGETSIHPFSGIINNFVVYNKALEEQECNFIINNNNNSSDLIPEFNNDFNYTIVDEYLDTNQNIVTRSIYSDTDFTSCSFEGKTELLSVEYLKVTNKVINMAGMFYNCDSLISVNASGWDTSNVSEMWEMFCYCCSLEKIIGIENWNTSSLEDLTYTFMCCESLTSLNLSGWDTRKVYLVDETFSDCTYLEELNISNWDLSNADPDWLSNMFYISELDPENYWYDPDFKPYLKIIRCNNENTISLIVPYLPNRTEDSPGSLNIIGVDDINQVDISTAKSKYWYLYAGYICKAEMIKYKSRMMGNKRIGKPYIAGSKKL